MPWLFLSLTDYTFIMLFADVKKVNKKLVIYINDIAFSLNWVKPVSSRNNGMQEDKKNNNMTHGEIHL